jgi:hypothetical protein
LATLPWHHKQSCGAGAASFWDAGTVTPCGLGSGSGSDSSKCDVQHGKFSKMAQTEWFYFFFFLFVFTKIFIPQNQKKKNVRIYVNFILLKIFGLIYRRVQAGAAGAVSKYLPRAGAA